jgi:hypothetical protein
VEPAVITGALEPAFAMAASVAVISCGAALGVAAAEATGALAVLAAAC